MEILGSAKSVYSVPDPVRSAEQGLREQFARLERNVNEVARGESGNGFAAGSQQRALLEQQEILRNTRANARSLETANRALGTIIDIRV